MYQTCDEDLECRVAVLGADGSQPLENATIEPGPRLASGPLGTVSLAPGGRRAVVIDYSPGSGPMTSIVNLVTGDRIELGQLDPIGPRTIHWSRDGAYFTTTDELNGRIIVVRVSDGERVLVSSTVADVVLGFDDHLDPS